MIAMIAELAPAPPNPARTGAIRVTRSKLRHNDHHRIMDDLPQYDRGRSSWPMTSSGTITADRAGE
jgi:hypothetical protein